jgi:hypothetical protein
MIKNLVENITDIILALGFISFLLLILDDMGRN